MPQPVQVAFWAGMVDFVGDGPDNLDDVLASIDAAWEAPVDGDEGEDH